MAERRDRRKIKQTRDGVQVEVQLPGRVLRASGPERAIIRSQPPPVRCPYCEDEGREGRSVRVTGARGVAYYKCGECCDPESGEPSRFKVVAP